jgi:hypothetical protein
MIAPVETQQIIALAAAIRGYLDWQRRLVELREHRRKQRRLKHEERKRLEEA